MTLTICRTPDDIRSWREYHQKVALVPTMGNLHAGHLALIHKARKLADHVAVSIFVNPAQFAAGEDLAAYPRSFNEDLKRAAKAGATVIFAPDEETMYPEKQTIWVHPGELGSILEGKTRPGHFQGVLTVVAKLLHLVTPDAAVFGKKDYQQLVLIRRMVGELNFATAIHTGEIERDEDGLALSSRNQYLTPQEREKAPELHQALLFLKEAIEETPEDFDFAVLGEHAARHLTTRGFDVDYVTLRRREDLAVPSDTDRHLVLLVAAVLGTTRLIDNLELTLPKPAV